MPQTAILVAILATYVTTIAQLVGVTARIDRKLPAGPRSCISALWFVVSLPIFLVESFFFLLTNADVLMVGAYMQPDDVAVYFATVKTLALVHFVYFAVKAGVAQRYAHYHPWRAREARRLRPRDRRLDLLAVAGHGACRAGARRADADAVRPRLRGRLSAALPAGHRRRRARGGRALRKPADHERQPERLRAGLCADAGASTSGSASC